MIYNFADENSLHSSHKKICVVEHSFQLSLNVTSDWCQSNRMVLHPKKSKCIVFTTRQKHQMKKITLKLHIKSQPIEQVNQHRVLGVTLDSEFK